MRSPLITTWKVLQYPIGLVVAGLVSVLTALLFVRLGMLMHVFVGFLGVFVGSLFFIPECRRAGAIFLALIGIAFFYIRFVWYDGGHGALPDSKLRLVLISTGAFIAIISHALWHSRLRKNTHHNTL